MRSGRRLIQRYIVAAVLPYLLMSVFLLTAVLLAQQSGRIAEILVVARVPGELLAEFALALIPNVLVFTLPMATLVGTLVGLSRMGTDSELVALRAAGVGTWQMLWPILLLGGLLTTLALWINVEGAPEAARTLRRTAVRAALYKLDSPVDPRTFNTEIPGYVIYVKDGDQTKGQWGRVFLFAQEKDGGTRLVTARSGRIDSSAEQSELVLSDAVLTRLPSAGNPEAAYVTERLEQLRVVLDTGRKELMAGLYKEDARPEEMDLEALFANNGSEQERRDRLTLAHRRLALSMGPLIFALLGAGLGLRVRKGGRGLGLLLSLGVLIVYYLVGLFGEQMARAGTVPAFVGVWTASVLTILCASVLLFRSAGSLLPQFLKATQRTRTGPAVEGSKSSVRRVKALARGRLPGFPGLLDKTVIRLLSFSFLVVFAALTAIILIFTLFELWRSIIERGISGRTVAQYLLYLLPFISVQMTAPSMLVAVLATYALMARRSEAVAWWACGQSVFRLALPGLFLALCAGFAAWMVQERLMPEANLRQDALRAQIRTGATRAATQAGRFWLASAETGRLYAYESEGAGETLGEVWVYEFDKDGVHLVRVVRGKRGGWDSLGKMVLGGVQLIDLKGAGGGVRRENVEILPLEPSDGVELFKPWTNKPSQLSAKELSAYISTIRRKGGVVAPLMVALQRKYAEPLGVVVMTLIGIPLALAFGRRSAVAALSSAVAVGLAFWGTTSGAQQLGSYGLLPPVVAAWAPIVIFGATGTYLLARART